MWSVKEKNRLEAFSDGVLAIIISEKNKVSVIEVKSSGYKTHSSIDAFSSKYSSRIMRKILLLKIIKKKNP